MASKKKRVAETQITKDTPEDEQEKDVESSSWKEADGEKIKQRKFLKVKRKDGELEPDREAPQGSEATTKALPSFDFGVESSETAPSFDFQWKGSGDTEKDSSTSGEKEGTTGSETDSSSSNSWNFTWGGDSGGFGAFDASAFKSFGSVASSAGTESAFSSTGSESLEATASAFVEPPPPAAASAQIFKDKKAEKAGTEDDQTLLRVQGKVYVIREEASAPESGNEAEDSATTSKTEQKFVESGHGDLHVNLFQEEGKTRARLVLRMEKTQRLVLNAPIFKDMDYRIQGEKFLRLISFNLEGKPTLYLLKFKTKQDAQQVKLKIDSSIKRIGTPYGELSKEPEPEPEPESEPSEETIGTA